MKPYMENTKAELLNLLEKYLIHTSAYSKAQTIAESIIADGWVNPPVDEGQTVYVVREYNGKKIMGLYVAKQVLIKNRAFHIQMESISTGGVIDVTDKAFGNFVFLNEYDAMKSCTA